MNRRNLLRFLPASIAVAIGGAAVASSTKVEAPSRPKALLVTTEEGGDFRLPFVAADRWQPPRLVHSIFFDDGSVWDATLAARGFQDGWRYGSDAVRAADHARWAEEIRLARPFNFTRSEGYHKVIV